MKRDTQQRVREAVDKLLELVAKLQEQKGGPGSGRHPAGTHVDGTDGDGERAKPRSGVRPSAVNPNRHEIEYTEQPSERPRSGVRPTRVKPPKH